MSAVCLEVHVCGINYLCVSHLIYPASVGRHWLGKHGVSEIFVVVIKKYATCVTTLIINVFFLSSSNYAVQYYILPGVPKKTGHCLISCNVKAIKAIAMKWRSLHWERTNLDFDI
jgi:hypothetical protein